MKNGTTAFQEVWLGLWMLAFTGAAIWSWWLAIVGQNLLYIMLCPFSILAFGSAAVFCFACALSKIRKKDKPG